MVEDSGVKMDQKDVEDGSGSQVKEADQASGERPELIERLEDDLDALIQGIDQVGIQEETKQLEKPE